MGRSNGVNITIEGSSLFLEAAYDHLGYRNGQLLDAVLLPEPGSDEAVGWLEKGDWLATAKKVNAKKVFFVRNDPVIVFSEFKQVPTEAELLNLFRRVWCMARPQRLFLALPGELRVYGLNQPPPDATAEEKSVEPLVTVKKVADVLEKLQAYRREQLESGYLPEDDRFGKPSTRADRRLIQDLKAVRKSLIHAGLKAEHAHALIGRSIFIRYLEDRGVLTDEYFFRIAKKNPHWQDLLSQSFPKPAVIQDEEWKKRRYVRVLRDKEFTYALFLELANDFNGDLFPKDEKEKEAVESKHLDLLRRFLLGDTNPQQPRLFFWAYNFEIIPLALISSIYEEFYHQSQKDDKGTHYTPSVLVEFVLAQVLPPERLAEHPKILDPACGSGIFLVESFRRIVRYQVQTLGRALSALELRQILRDQIRGIEINQGAAYVAAFSLYLALLHYQKSPDILAQIETPEPNSKPLPHLICDEEQPQDATHYQVIFNSNAFALTADERKELEERVAQKKVFAGRANHKRLLDAGLKLDLERRTFDVIVGNPPWFEVGSNLPFLSCADLPPLAAVPKPFTYHKKSHTLRISKEILPSHLERAKQSLPLAYHPLLSQLKSLSDHCFQAIRWAKAYHLPVGEAGYSQLFIHRAQSLLKENGQVGLLVHSNVLFNQRRTSKEFRRFWLSSAKIRQLVNFVHVRKLFFDQAIAPFVFVSFEPCRSLSWDHHFVYTSARLTPAVRQLRAVMLSKADRRVVNQLEIAHKDYLWKTYWWGSHRDASLMARFEIEDDLENILNQIGSSPGYGFQRGRKVPSLTLQNLRTLASKSLKPYGPLRDDWFEPAPKGVKRPNGKSSTARNGKNGPHPLNPPLPILGEGEDLLRNIKNLRFFIPRLPLSQSWETRQRQGGEGCFRAVLVFPSLPNWQAKVILAIFCSSLGQYKLFMTSASWGTWYDQIVPQDILSMPIKMVPEDNPIVQKIVSIVDAIRSWNPTRLAPLQPRGLEQAPSKEMLRELDLAVFDLFDLYEPERDLIYDFLDYGFDLFRKGAHSTALNRTRTALSEAQGTIHALPTRRNSLNELEGYIYAFLDMWNHEFEPDGELRWRVIHPTTCQMLAVILTTQWKESPLPEIETSDDEEWERVLEQCASALQQPISRDVYLDGIVRAVTDTDIFIIKRDERRLWTRSIAREDAEATLLQAMYLQEAAQEE